MVLFQTFEADNDAYMKPCHGQQAIFVLQFYIHSLHKKKNSPRFTFPWKCSALDIIFHVESWRQYFDEQHCIHNSIIEFRMQRLLGSSELRLEGRTLVCLQWGHKKFQRCWSKHLLVCSSHMHCLQSWIFIFLSALRRYKHVHSEQHKESCSTHLVPCVKCWRGHVQGRIHT